MFSGAKPELNTTGPQFETERWSAPMRIVRDSGLDLFTELDRQFIGSYLSRAHSKVLHILPTGAPDLGTQSAPEYTHLIHATDVKPNVSINPHLMKLNGLLLDAGLLLYRIDSRNVLDFEKLSCRRAMLQLKLNRGLSLAEWMGRMVYCGFDIIEYRLHSDCVWIVAMKTRSGQLPEKPSEKWIFPMVRVGYLGQPIKVYKLRTMHPYSEFLQDFVVRLNGYAHSGKPACDFRVTAWGRWLRRFWVDEAPQLWNLLKGEMVLVGVRPLSKYRFKELPEDLQVLRMQYKPGCIPPYVSLLMPDSDGNVEAERIYLREKKEHAFWTDFRYLVLAIRNILLGRILGA